MSHPVVLLFCHFMITLAYPVSVEPEAERIRRKRRWKIVVGALMSQACTCVHPLTSYWPERGHVASSSCKGGWEIEFDSMSAKR